MVDDFWSMDRCSQDSDGKWAVWRRNSRRSENPGKYMENPIFPQDEGCQKGEWRWATWGPHHPLAWATPGRATRWCGHPGPPPASPFGVYNPLETLRLGEQPQKGSAASVGRKLQREKELSGRQKSTGDIPFRRGEIIAINTVIKLGFIGIIIIITPSSLPAPSSPLRPTVTIVLDIALVLRGNFPGVNYYCS